MTPRASLAALALALLAVPAALAAPPAARPAARPAAPTRPVAPRPVGPALPDTVLARVEFPGGETRITASEWRQAAQKLNTSVDSLPPEARMQMLGLVLQQTVLDQHVARVRPRWQARDSANFRRFEEALVLRAALDSAMTHARKRAAVLEGKAPGEDELETMASREALAGLHASYDAAALDSLGARFAALPRDDSRLPVSRRVEILKALPVVSHVDSARMLARCDLDSCTTAQLLGEIAARGTLRRPPLRTGDDLRGVVDQRFFGMALRRAAARQRLATRPDIAAQLVLHRRFLSAQRYVQNEAYDRVPIDSATVRRFYERDPRRYDLGGGAQIVRLLFGTRAEAETGARDLARPGVADSLAPLQMPGGIPYSAGLAEDADTALFARVRAGGVGAVIGPDPTPDGWRIFRVMSLTPRTPQTFEQAFTRARGDWVGVDGDRRMGELVERLMQQCKVVVNETSPLLTGRPRPAR